MKITFMIGNGFDLRLGMNTRYTNMYSGYLQKSSTVSPVAEFKKILQLDAPNGYRTWGDFEIAMAQHASHFKAEDDLIVCVRDFKDHLGSHLNKEQAEFMEYLKAQNGYQACAKEMRRSLLGFHKGQIPNVINSINALGDIEYANFSFISFNYTTILDQIIQRHNSSFKDAAVESPIHIHGSLETDIVLGIDNAYQFVNLPYRISRRGERAFVKPFFNSQFDKARVAAAEKAIEESDVICIYGMSLGPSDKSWTNKVYDWIIADPNHHLVYYKHLNQVFTAWRRDEMMDVEDAHRRELLKRLCGEEVIDGIEDQIHIPIGYDIFDFRSAIDKEAELRSRLQFSTPGSMKSY